MLYRTSKDKNHPYVMLNKTFLHDPNLSLKAKGLLAYCMSMPDGWQFHISQMQTVLKEGRDALNSAFKELIKFGYCERIQNKNEKGQYDNGEYLIYESPITIKDQEKTTEKPQTENPSSVIATSETPPLVINDVSDNENNNNKQEEVVVVPKKRNKNYFSHHKYFQVLKMETFLKNMSEKKGEHWKIEKFHLLGLCMDYGVEYVTDQLNYMLKKQDQAEKDAENAYKKKKTDPIDKPLTYLSLACKENYARSDKNINTG